MGFDKTGVKLLTVKVRAKASHRTPETNLVSFQGINPQSTKRRYVGEEFEILATPYKKEKSYWKRNEDDFKRTQVQGDPRAAHCAHPEFSHWSDENKAAYQRFQFFDPETMELVDKLEPADDEGDPSDTLPNDYLLKLDEKAAIKAVRKQEKDGTLQAWLAAEKVSDSPREKVLKALEEAIAEE